MRRKHFQRQKQRDMTNKDATVVTEIRMVRAVPTAGRKIDTKKILNTNHSVFILTLQDSDLNVSS